MSVVLQDIQTIGDLFKKGILRTAENPIYPARATVLERVSLYQGDITKLQTDAIVNAANRFLIVDRAIHAAAGRQLAAECAKLGGCKTGDAKITAGYNLPAKHVIHTVGPMYDKDDVEACAKELASCYRVSLQLAQKNSCETIAFPSISTGIYGYPIRDATRIALNEVRQFVDADSEAQIKRIIFVVFMDTDRSAYEDLIPSS
ncbi:A1pp-domain-containing protein [Scleroderma citrinum]